MERDRGFTGFTGRRLAADSWISTIRRGSTSITAAGGGTSATAATGAASRFAAAGGRDFMAARRSKRERGSTASRAETSTARQRFTAVKASRASTGMPQLVGRKDSEAARDFAAIADSAEARSAAAVDFMAARLAVAGSMEEAGTEGGGNNHNQDASKRPARLIAGLFLLG